MLEPKSSSRQFAHGVPGQGARSGVAVLSYDAISVDVPWSARTRSRTAIAAWSGGQALVVTEGLDGEGLRHWIAEHASTGGLVVLDVPIDGCAGLCRSVPRRDLDDRLARVGIPILPSYKSGDLGPRLRAALAHQRPDLTIVESYPYAVLRVLWGLRQEAGIVDLSSKSYRLHVSPWPTWWRWPPRYKRHPTVAGRHEALAAVADILRSCDESYAALVRAPRLGTSAELAHLSDEYDAVLGLVAARAAVEGSSWSWNAEVPEAGGSILTIGPPWLRERFATQGP